MFALVPHCQRFNGCLNPCRIHSTVLSNLISLIFTLSHRQSLVVCNDINYKSKVALLPRLMAAFRRTTIRPQFFQIFRLYVALYAQVLLSPFRTPNFTVAKRKVGVRVDSVPLKTGLAMFALVAHCQRFNGCLNPCRIHSTVTKSCCPQVLCALAQQTLRLCLLADPATKKI